LHRRTIGHGRADGGAGRGQDDAERGDKHAVGTRNRVIGFGWHWSRTRSVKGFAWSIRLGLCRPLRLASPPSASSNRSCYVNQAVFDSCVSSKKFRIVPSTRTGTLMPAQKTNR